MLYLFTCIANLHIYQMLPFYCVTVFDNDNDNEKNNNNDKDNDNGNDNDNDNANGNANDNGNRYIKDKCSNE